MKKESELKSGQLEILKLLYKYRFGSRQLLAESLGITAGTSLYKRLEVLISYELLAKRQDKKSKLLGIPAAYYLTPKGLRALQKLSGHEQITEAVIKSSYKNGTIGLPFVLQTIKIYQMTNALKRVYPELKVFLSRDMNRYSYFPSIPPDAFLSLKISDTPKRFFLDIVHDSMPRNILDRRITVYGQFFDNGGWDATGSELPALLLITEKGATETRTRRAVRAALSRIDMDDDIDTYTTTFKAIENSDGDGKIWTEINDPDELLTLEDT